MTNLRHSSSIINNQVYCISYCCWHDASNIVVVISNELNNKIIQLAPAHTASIVAPSTFEDLKAQSTSGLVVWSGASDNTIYGDARVNHAFRAWHDSIHLAINAPFTVEGERLVALEQCRLIGSDNMASIIMAEVDGQVEYFNKHGKFPINQLDFVINYLKGII